MNGSIEWIVQEFGLSKKGLVICGREGIPQEVLPRLVTMFSVFAPNVCRRYNALSEVQQAYNMMTAYTLSHINLMVDPEVAVV